MAIDRRCNRYVAHELARGLGDLSLGSPAPPPEIVVARTGPAWNHPHPMKRTISAISLGLVLLGLTGCIKKKASWIPNDHGGYTLMTQSESVDQAVTRFRRTAGDLCGEAAPYKLSDPVITATAWTSVGSLVTFQTNLACQ